MNYLKLGVAALGVACIVAAALLPQVAMLLNPAGAGLLGWVLPNTLLEKKKDDSQN
jgi:hypothetical protein